jgi:hypothetical protein
MRRSGFSAALLTVLLLAACASSQPAFAQAQTPIQVQTQTEAGCGAEGYRVVARRWDALLERNLEVRQDCAHPEWPTRLVALGSAGARPMAHGGSVRTNEVAQVAAPLLVHAGDHVRLWSQDEMVRIEMSGVVEQSARSGDRVIVQIMRQSDDTGMSVERIAGTVRGAGDVEMER